MADQRSIAESTLTNGDDFTERDLDSRKSNKSSLLTRLGKKSSRILRKSGVTDDAATRTSRSRASGRQSRASERSSGQQSEGDGTRRSRSRSITRGIARSLSRTRSRSQSRERGTGEDRGRLLDGDAGGSSDLGGGGGIPREISAEDYHDESDHRSSRRSTSRGRSSHRGASSSVGGSSSHRRSRSTSVGRGAETYNEGKRDNETLREYWKRREQEAHDRAVSGVAAAAAAGGNKDRGSSLRDVDGSGSIASKQSKRSASAGRAGRSSYGDDWGPSKPGQDTPDRAGSRSVRSRSTSVSRQQRRERSSSRHSHRRSSRELTKEEREVRREERRRLRALKKEQKSDGGGDGGSESSRVSQRYADTIDADLADLDVGTGFVNDGDDVLKSMSSPNSKEEGGEEEDAFEKMWSNDHQHPAAAEGVKQSKSKAAINDAEEAQQQAQQQRQSRGAAPHDLRASITAEFVGGGEETNLDIDSTAPSNGIDLHKDLASGSWAQLHQHLQHLSTRHDLVLPTLTQTDPTDGSTPLHTASWKAPPSLALMLVRLLPTSRELRGLFLAKDRDQNTALHLCCANLEPPTSDSIEAAHTGRSARLLSGKEPSIGSIHSTATGQQPGAVHTAVVEALVKAAPRAVLLQNAEGDTPLHLLVSGPVCTVLSSSKMKSSSHSDSFNQLALLTANAERVTSLLLECPTGPDACLLRDETGATPLHVALAANSHERVLHRLIDACPQSVRVKDNRGMLPLHYAAAFCRFVPVSVVQRLLELHPGGLVSPTSNGDAPLHLAISNSGSHGVSSSSGGVGGAGGEPALDDGVGGVGGGGSNARLDRNVVKIVELLMGPSYRESGEEGGDGGGGASASSDRGPILITNREKLTPLHCCALFDAPPQLTRLLMKHPAAKKAASMTNSFGATPLHLAAAQPGVAQSIATVVAIGTPEAAAVQDRLKRTPLHVAAQNIHASNLLIKSLAELNPEATAVKTQRGHLPLHLAAQSQAKEPVIKALIKAFPMATEARNKSSNTPLHDAAKYRASAGVVKLLLDTYPDAVFVQNQYGNLPLHCATAYQAPSDVVQLLLKAWPDGACMQNRNQDAPLHYAAAYATSADAVKPLIDAAPAAVLLLNSSGQSPIDRARANNAPEEIIELLETSAENYSKTAASEGFGHFPSGFDANFE